MAVSRLSQRWTVSGNALRGSVEITTGGVEFWRAGVHSGGGWSSLRPEGSCLQARAFFERISRAADNGLTMASRSIVRVCCALALSAAVACAANLAGAVPLLTGFGGPTGYGLPEHCLHPSDNGSYAGPPPTTGFPAVPVDLTPAFSSGLLYFGAVYRAMYVNTNGNISFLGPLPNDTPAPFPLAMQPMIAPWWGDVDTRGGGQPARNNICFHLEPGRVVVTWNNVGHFAAHDELLNDFQLVLTSTNLCRSTGNFDVEFRYNRCEWSTGDGGSGTLGSVPAQVGFDAGNRRNYVALPMSRTRAIVEVCRLSNVPGGPPGLWRFQVRGSGIVAGCAGGGFPCAVPERRGACAEGVNVCVGSGVRCAQVNEPYGERCNGVDDDCDGEVDEEGGLCGPDAACDRGVCAARCSGELVCAAGRRCTPGGVCVDAECAAVACAAGRRCVRGACVDPCEGVTCPEGRACRAGRCRDVCEGVTCDVTEVCERPWGRCVPACRCVPCADGGSCQPDGRCVPADCAGVTCPAGRFCRGGVCRDACEAAPGTRLCPSGERCWEGACVVDRDPQADAAAPRGDLGAGGDAAAVPDDGPPTTRPVEAGCVCAAALGSRSRPRGHVGLALGVAAFALRRRRDRAMRWSTRCVASRSLPS